jgi:serine/threonine-protein kinase
MAGSRRIGGRYRLVEPLGSGGMSVVWRAFDEVLQRSVAVKVLAGDLAGDPTLAEAIRREAQAAARITHPHIASVYDYGESTVDGGDPTPFVVMELVLGEPLSTLLAGGARLPWREAAGICAQVASALSEAHAHGVVHRDVKPGNVMIGRSGAKVVDFGISALVGECDLDEDGHLLGTPAYVAPERLEGGRAETASDVWAVGVLLYRTLTGRLPWRADTPQELIQAHREGVPPSLRELDDLDGVPDEVRRACRDCLARDPEQRPRSDELAGVLGAAAGVPVVFPSPVAVRATSRSGSTTAWLAVQDPTAGFDVADLWPARSWSASVAQSWSAWFARSRARRMVAVALLAVLGLAVAAAAYGSASRPPPQASTLGDQNGRAGVGAAPVPGCRVHYQVERDWRTGFEAVVTVTNAGPRDIAGATLRFRFPGEQALVRRGQWRQQGQEMTADVALAMGTSVRLPFTARYRGENPLPLSFLVDDITCEAVVTGPRGVHLVDNASDESSGSSDNASGNRGPGPDKPKPGEDKPKPGDDKPKKHSDDSGPGSEESGSDNSGPGSGSGSGSRSDDLHDSESNVA